MTAPCPDCGQTVRTVVPRGGDGSVEVYVRHKNADGARCFGSRSEARPISGDIGADA